MDALRARYRRVERLLATRWERLRRAQDEIEAAQAGIGLRGKALDAAPRASGGFGDPTARQAAALAEARTRYDRAYAWVRLGRDIAIQLGDSFEGRVFDGCYADGLTEAGMARREGCNRSRVKRARESIIQLAAILAAERGLLGRKGDGADEGDG